MYGLDLFSGIGGITKALDGYVEPIAYCENDRYACGVLLSRMQRADIIAAPIWDDVRTLHGYMLPIAPDIIYGGFPCQDISVAGREAGLGGKRSGLFFEITRIVSQIRPEFIFLENVPVIRTRGADVVVKELASLGYDCRWDTVSAAEIGAPHLRERWFMLAKSNSKHGETRMGDQQNGEKKICRKNSKHGHEFWVQAPSKDRRMDDGIPYSVDSVRALGNSVVPAQAREAFERLMGLKSNG